MIIRSKYERIWRIQKNESVTKWSTISKMAIWQALEEGEIICKDNPNISILTVPHILI